MTLSEIPLLHSRRVWILSGFIRENVRERGGACICAHLEGVVQSDEMTCMMRIGLQKPYVLFVVVTIRSPCLTRSNRFSK